MSHKITCKFGGRLGNIMLEIFDAFLLCQRNKIDFDNIIFNRHYYEPIGVFKNGSPCPDNDYISTQQDILLNDFLKDKFIDEQHYNEIFHNPVTENFDNLQKYITKKGFTQNMALLPYYFVLPSNNTERILFQKIFTPNSDIVEKIKHTNENFFNPGCITCAVHIRLTDYRQFRNGRGIQSKEEIMNSITKYAKQHSQPVNFVVFSDDIQWCMKNITGKNIQYKETGSATEDVILMSVMDDIISGTSSTYAYVSKLLNKNIKNLPYRKLC